MPVQPILARLQADEPEFTVALGVLACLSTAGFEEVAAGVGDYVGRGRREPEALDVLNTMDTGLGGARRASARLGS